MSVRVCVCPYWYVLACNFMPEQPAENVPLHSAYVYFEAEYISTAVKCIRASLLSHSV